jgi:hypothetical protein
VNGRVWSLEFLQLPALGLYCSIGYNFGTPLPPPLFHSPSQISRPIVIYVFAFYRIILRLHIYSVTGMYVRKYNQCHMGKKCEKVKKKEANLIEEEARRKSKETYKSKGKDKNKRKKD